MQVIIDERVDENICKYFLSIGYEIIKVKKCSSVYNEVSSHTDIFCTKIHDTVICAEGSIIDKLSDKYICLNGDNVDNNVASYNVCIIDNYAIHNFDLTDKKVLEILNQKKYKLINVKQGYSRCSILPLGNKSCITSDKGIYNKLVQADFDVLYIDNCELNIKLFSSEGIYSNMSGFIGGCSCILDNTVIFFGDLDKFKCKEKLVNYIVEKGFKIKDFKKMDVIDYGSCIFLD